MIDMTRTSQNECEWAELYVLGGLSEEEKEVFETHLTHCLDCQKNVAELYDVVGLLPLASEQVDVPSGMKQRVLGHILHEQKVVAIDKQQSKAATSIWRKVLISGLSVAVILLSVVTYSLNQEINSLHSELEQMRNPSAMKMNQVVSLHPTAEDIVAKGLATIVIDEKGTHLIVQAEQLPELQGTEAFQVWLLKNEEPYNAGTFLPQQGTGALYYTFEAQEFDTVAITLEPDAQGEKPRGEIILAASIEKKS